MIFNIECFYNNHTQFKAIYEGMIDAEKKKQFNKNMMATPIYKKWVEKMKEQLKEYLADEAKKPEAIALNKKYLADLKKTKGHW